MSLIALFFLVLSTLCFVTGQICFKHAMTETPAGAPIVPRNSKTALAAGITAMALAFFINLALLQKFDLSYVYPFQGISVIIVTAAAVLILKEKVTLRLCIGVGLIAAGVTLVSVS